MAEYTETFAGYILQCRRSYDELCADLEAGNVPRGKNVKLVIEIPAATVDRMRFERIAALAEAN